MSWTVRDSAGLEDVLIQLSKGQVSLLELAEELPHGSGINSSWSVERCQNGTVHFRNSYHAMNDGGCYDGWYDFDVVLFRHKADKIQPLSGPLTGKTQVIWRKGDLDFKITGLRGKYSDAREWIYDGVSMAWGDKYGIGKMRRELLG